MSTLTDTLSGWRCISLNWLQTAIAQSRCKHRISPCRPVYLTLQFISNDKSGRCSDVYWMVLYVLRLKWICFAVFIKCLMFICYADDFFSERELTFTFAICYRPSVCRLSVCRLSSVTFVHPTQTVEIFVNISTALDTLAIHWRPLKILRRSSQGNPCAGRVKHKRGSKI